MWGIIPIKSLNQAKHRLKHVLYPQERQEFFKAMFEDVLSTMMSVPDFEQVAVATVCPAACIIAKNTVQSFYQRVRMKDKQLQLRGRPKFWTPEELQVCW